MRRLAILGASGHGKVVADTAESCGWDIVEFFDDAWPERERNSVWPIVGTFAELLQRLPGFDGVIVAIGDNTVRQVKLSELRSAGACLATLIHPEATISRYTNLGEETVAFAGVIVNSDTRVGAGSILNSGCSIDHDCVLNEAVHISPGAHLAGGVQVGDQAWIGIGSCVRQLVRIGVRAIVGAGALVINDVPDYVTIVGVPARILQRERTL